MYYFTGESSREDFSFLFFFGGRETNLLLQFYAGLLQCYTPPDSGPTKERFL